MKKISLILLLISIPILSFSQEEISDNVLEKLGNDYFQKLNYEEAVNAWNHLSVHQMKQANIESYAMAFYYLGEHTEGLNIAQQGLEKYPNSITLLRISMMCNVELSHYDGAINNGKLIFDKTDFLNYTDVDYYYYGRALSGVKKYKEAIIQYEKALNSATENRKISNEYIEQELLHSYADLGLVYLKQALEKEGDEKSSLLEQADTIFAEMVSRYPISEKYGLLLRAKTNSYLDPDSKMGKAIPYYQAITNIIHFKNDLDEKDKDMLSEAYQYLLSYYANIKSDLNTAKEYAQKLLLLEPNNTNALKLVNGK